MQYSRTLPRRRLSRYRWCNCAECRRSNQDKSRNQAHTRRWAIKRLHRWVRRQGRQEAAEEV